MDKENLKKTQIFTPDHIVEEMCNCIGDELLDFNKKILEPTSGDGQFTAFILKKRLENLKCNFPNDGLKCLKNIYSIELDKEHMDKQKERILKIMIEFAIEKKIVRYNEFLRKAEEIINKNFIWGEFNYNHNDLSTSNILAWKMPDKKPIYLTDKDFPE